VRTFAPTMPDLPVAFIYFRPTTLACVPFNSNPRILRSGILIMPDSPTALMQVMRLVSEAKLAERRVLTSVEAQMQWLGEVTTPKEQARLGTFLARSKS
jgi:hypothetical protein